MPVASARGRNVANIDEEGTMEISRITGADAVPTGFTAVRQQEEAREQPEQRKEPERVKESAFDRFA